MFLLGFRGESRLLVQLMHVHHQHLAGNHWRAFENFALFMGTLLLLPDSAVASLAVASAIYPQGNRNDLGRCFHLLKLQLMTMTILFYIFGEVAL